MNSQKVLIMYIQQILAKKIKFNYQDGYAADLDIFDVLIGGYVPQS